MGFISLWGRVANDAIFRVREIQTKNLNNAKSFSTSSEIKAWEINEHNMLYGEPTKILWGTQVCIVLVIYFTYLII